MHRIVLPLLIAGACAGRDVTKQEAHVTFDAVNTVTDDLVSSAVGSVEGTAGVFSVDASEDDWALEGALTDGRGWTGTVTLVGAVRSWNDPMGYELLVAFDGVSPVDPELDVVLDGEITLAFTFDYAMSGDLALEATIAIDGDLVLSGGHDGHAVLDYDLSLGVDGLDVSFTASGEISGHDVSGWPFGLSIPL